VFVKILLVFLLATTFVKGHAKDVFVKQVNIFGVRILATENVPDEKLLHAASVMAEYLDNDEDGEPDNPAVMEALVEERATLVMFVDEGEERNFDFDEFVEIDGSEALQLLFAEETLPEGSHYDAFDATLEEVLHLITQYGYALAHPDVFGEEPGTEIALAMDTARGGHLQEIPNPYPAGAWYSYDDETCEYNCMIAEYFYWALTSLLGAQDFPGRQDEIGHEWKLNTPEKLAATDTAIYKLLTNPEYSIPTLLPDGVYNGGELVIEDF
jgi:hypothetical protein